MLPKFQDNVYVSPEYNEFIEQYHKLLQYSIQISNLCVLIGTLEGGNTQVFSLYIQAVETHVTSINVYIRLVSIYEQLIQKYWNSAHG